MERRLREKWVRGMMKRDGGEIEREGRKGRWRRWEEKLKEKDCGKTWETGNLRELEVLMEKMGNEGERKRLREERKVVGKCSKRTKEKTRGRETENGIWR